jgi:hypothetical protein
MKFKQARPYADPETGIRKLLELANNLEADYAGRLNVGVLNIQFKEAGDDYVSMARPCVPRSRKATWPCIRPVLM